MGSPLLDVEELAQWLGVEQGFVRRLIAERRIPFVKIGKFVRFDPDEITAWIDGRRVGMEASSSRRGTSRKLTVTPVVIARPFSYMTDGLMRHSR